MKNRYDSYPYPERNPADETKRLLAGSPSNLTEVDHYIFGGMRDWSLPFRALVAGGGTGDAFIMLAQQLTDANVPHEVIYLDQSDESRKIAEKRAQKRGLDNVKYITADLLEVSNVGTFDYIDCCGVLHHLSDPLKGAAKLRSLLKDDGGFGGMVYAPLGRTGVYPLQSAFQTLFKNLTYEEQVKKAKETLQTLPKTNWINKNPFVGDHRVSDAGFFDLLLHTVDRPYFADELIMLLNDAGFELVSFIAPILYEPENYLPDDPKIRRIASKLNKAQKARLAEELIGSLKTHVFYAKPKGASFRHPTLGDDLVLHMDGSDTSLIAHHITAQKPLTITLDEQRFTRVFDKQTARVVKSINGRQTIREILKAIGWKRLKPTVERDLEFLVSTSQIMLSSLKKQSNTM